jgi:hypothetical protein
LAIGNFRGAGLLTPKGTELAISEEFALNSRPIIFILVEVLVSLIVVWLIVIAV